MFHSNGPSCNILNTILDRYNPVMLSNRLSDSQRPCVLLLTCATLTLNINCCLCYINAVGWSVRSMSFDYPRQFPSSILFVCNSIFLKPARQIECTNMESDSDTNLKDPLLIGQHSGESTRLPPMWPGFEPRRRRHMWVDFVVGTVPCYKRFFSRYSGSPLSLKNNTSKFLFDLERTNTFQHRRPRRSMCH